MTPIGRVAPALAAALLLSVAAAAVELVVSGPGGTPLAGARISVVGRPGSVVADGEGRCRLEPTPELPFVLFVARPDGVALAPVTVAALPESGPLRVTVGVAGETVTVVSGVVPDLELPPAVAATVIGRGDLEHRAPPTVADALDTVPGVTRAGEGLSVVPGLRGLPKHRTLLLLDDGRVSAERRAGASASFVDPATIDEVEVIRGPGTVAYGSDAFGGVIRLRSRMPSPGAAPELRFRLAGGTVAGERGAVAELSRSALGGGLLIGVHARDAGDYRSPLGEVLDSGYATRGLRLAWQAALGNGIVHLGWRSDLARDVGKPAPDSLVKRTSYPREDSHRLTLGFERPGPGRWRRLAASLAWDAYRLVLDKERVASADEPRRVDRSDVRANDYGLRVEAERALGRWRLVAGLDASGRFGLDAAGSQRRYDVEGRLVERTSEVAVEDARRDDLGLFAALGRELGRWRVDAGLRGDRVASRSGGGYFGRRASSSSALSGFAALGLELRPGLEATFQLARGFRAPLLSDRYYRGETGRGTIIGNPELEPETSRQVDLALRWRRRGWQLAAYAYRYRIEELIERYREGEEYRFRNRGSATVSGLELEASLPLGARLELDLGAQWARGEVGDDKAPTDDVPAPGLLLALRGASEARRWSWSVRAAGFLRDERPGPSELVVPGHLIVDASLGRELGHGLELRLLGHNLLDRFFPGSADENAVPAPGRGLVLSLAGRL